MENNIITPKLSNELNAIFENADVVLMLVDTQGRVVNINPAGLDLIRKEKKYVIGKQNGEVFSCINAFKNGKPVCGNTKACRDCTVRHQINTALTDKTRQEKEDGKLTVFDNEGNKKVLNLLVSTSNISINEEDFMLLTIDEVSKIKQQEEQLKLLNDDKNKFLSILSHDLRSPYNSFIGFTEILLKSWRTMPPEKVDKILSSLLNVSRNSYELLNDLLSWAKSQSGKTQFQPQEIKFSEVFENVNNALQYTAELKHIKLKLINSKNCIVYADTKMLSTILRNLMSNAIKFSEKESSIIIETKETASDVTVSITDEGTGISEETQAHLFDISRVSSTPGTDGEKGSGLGLLLCKEFVEKHKGKISVTSRLGHGSTFSFTLPNKKH